MMLKMILRTWNYKKSYMFRNGTEIVQRKKQCILRWVHFDVETEPEKYYRELLMLFTHWRNEVKDLKGNCLLKLCI